MGCATQGYISESWHPSGCRFGEASLTAGSEPIRARRLFQQEMDETYKTLVSGLAFSLLPSAIMGATIVAVGIFAYLQVGSPAILGAALVGMAASLAKLVVLVAHQLRLRQAVPSVEEARLWELVHTVTTCLVASSVGGLSAGLFARLDAGLHVLGTALVFGYCSGVAMRLFIRPRLAIAAVVIAALPPAISTLVFGSGADRLLGLILLVFLCGSLESIRHIYDVSVQEIESRITMTRLARTDALTGLGNRLALQDLRTLPPPRDEGWMAVHCFDLDEFKSINDRFGHDTGDALLRALAGRIKRLIGEHDIAVRLGGDEFAIIQTGLGGADEAECFAMRLADHLMQPYDLTGRTVTMRVSHGYAAAPAASVRLDDMLRRADAASYRAKSRGGGVEAALG